MPKSSRVTMSRGVRTATATDAAPCSTRSVAISAPLFPRPTTSARTFELTARPIFARVEKTTLELVDAWPGGNARLRIVARRDDRPPSRAFFARSRAPTGGLRREQDELRPRFRERHAEAKPLRIPGEVGRVLVLRVARIAARYRVSGRARRIAESCGDGDARTGVTKYRRSDRPGRGRARPLRGWRALRQSGPAAPAPTITTAQLPTWKLPSA